MIENLQYLHLQNTVAWPPVTDNDWDDDDSLPPPAVIEPPRTITAAQREAEHNAAWIAALERGL